jgi:hypothetical protein
MKRMLNLIAVTLLAILIAVPAGAYLDSVVITPSVIAAEPFDVIVFGSHPDPCWGVVDFGYVISGNVVTLDVYTEFTEPPGTICPAVLEPYEVTEQVTVPTEGDWLLRVVEHRPDWPPFIFDTIEVSFTADAPVAVLTISWGSLRARYR